MAFLQEYTMLDELGKGGFATVYKVRHNELGYIRAIRVLNEMIVNANSAPYQKFLRECKVLLRLGNGSHPNIVHIYQPRLLENKALVEMDYVDGQDITHFLKQEHHFVPIDEVLRMAEQISSALAYCHEDIYRFCMDRDLDKLQDDPNDGSKVLMNEATRQRLISKYKVIHNDIHSGNIMRRENGNFVLLDFGLAINGDEVVRSSRHANGAPEFKAPEKWDGESILSEQSDIYSFGVVLYEMLAGRVPFPMDTHIPNYKAESFVAEAHKNSPVPSILPIRQNAYEAKFSGQHYVQDYPAWLEEVILKCLAKNPAERYTNGRELHTAIATGIAQMRDLRVESLQVTITRMEKENATMQQQLLQIEAAQHHVKDALQQQEDAIAKKQEQLNEAQNELKAQAAALDADRKQLNTEQQDLIHNAKALKDKEQRLNNERNELQKQANELNQERENLKKETEKPIKKWKAISIKLLMLFLLCCVWAVYGWKKDSIDTPPVTTEQNTVDSLQQVIGHLNSKINAMENSANGNTTALLEQVNELEKQNQQLEQEKTQLQSDNQSLREKSTYNGHDAKYWYDNRLYNGHDAKYWYDNRLYNGHDAKYWYNNRLYKGENAQHWYNKYMGYE